MRARGRVASASIALGWVVMGACSTTTGKTQQPPADGGSEASSYTGPACSFPPAATPYDDASLFGCQGVFPAPSCAAGQFEVYCVGPFDGGAEASVPAPAASAGCAISSQATIPNGIYWCCPCGP